MRRNLREFFPECEEDMKNQSIKHEIKPLQNFIKKEDQNEASEIDENKIDFKFNDIQFQPIQEFRNNNPYESLEDRILLGKSELQNKHKDDSSNIVDDDFNKAKATDEIDDLMAVKGNVILNQNYYKKITFADDMILTFFCIILATILTGCLHYLFYRKYSSNNLVKFRFIIKICIKIVYYDFSYYNIEFVLVI